MSEESVETVTIRTDNGPALWYVGTDNTLYRLDQFDSGTLGQRETALARTVIQLALAALDEDRP